MKTSKNKRRHTCISAICACAMAINSDALTFRSAQAADLQTQVRNGYFTDSVVTKSEVILYDERLDRSIDEIGQKLAAAAGRIWPEAREFRFKFRVINSSEINAASVSGGYIYIYTGMLDYLTSVDELAAVIGHEIGHVVRGHYTESIETADRTAKAIGFGAAVLGIALGVTAGYVAGRSSGNSSPSARADIVRGTTQLAVVASTIGLGFTGVAIGKAMLEGYAQDHEFEADAMGARIGREAGYDPRAMISVMRRLAYLDDSVEALRKKAKDDHWSHEKLHFLNASPGLSKRAAALEASLGR